MNDATPQAIPGQPSDEAGLVFRAPWEAKTFAMAVELNARGVFTWPEWTARFSTAIRASEDAGKAVNSDNYYTLWQRTLESLVREKCGLNID